MYLPESLVGSTGLTHVGNAVHSSTLELAAIEFINSSSQVCGGLELDKATTPR
jgi:hypothetical protein